VAHEFLGTFNKSQHDRFVAFAKAQTEDILGRITHLTAEQFRIGKLAFSYDSGGSPLGYVPQPQNSYIGRLLACYEILGGDPKHDLNIRSMAQPVFLLAGDETKPAQLLSNGEVMGAPGLADGDSAVLVQAARAWLPDVLQYKRDYLERKIRRMLDYSDQLQAEITLLQTIVAAKETDGSLEFIFDQVNQLLSDPTYRAIYDDKGKDPLAKKVYAPFKPYLGGPDVVPSDNYGRDVNGTTAPGEGTA
jgi:hypothetical protein